MNIEVNPPVCADVACFAIVPLNRKIIIVDTEPETGRTCRTILERLDRDRLLLSHWDWHRARFIVSIDLRSGMAQLHEDYLGDLRYAEVSTREIVETCRKYLQHQEMN